MSEHVPVKLGDDVWDACVLPRSISERYELVTANIVHVELTQAYRVFATALALCWPLLRAHMTARRVEYTGDALRYGLAVLDEMAAQGAVREDVLRAGKSALEAIDRSLMPVMEASKDPEGFSEPPSTAGSAVSSSPSSDPGASGPETSVPTSPT